MTIDSKKISELAELLKKHDLTEIEVKDKDKAVKVCRSLTQAAAPIQVTTTSNPEEKPKQKENISGTAIKSPMVGTVYLSPAPGAKQFVNIGDRVKAGDVICLIEAMKMFNKIKAETTGIVSKISVKNEHPVEFGTELFVITEN